MSEERMIIELPEKMKAESDRRKLQAAVDSAVKYNEPFDIIPTRMHNIEKKRSMLKGGGMGLLGIGITGLVGFGICKVAECLLGKKIDENWMSID